MATQKKNTGAGLTLDLPPDVTEWLGQRPEGAATFIEAAVRRSMQGDDSARIATAVRDALRAQEGPLTASILQALSAPPSVDPAPSPWGPPKTAAPPPVEDCKASLAEIEARDPAVARRAAKFVRYPQLVQAVAKELVSIERAEEMAEEADARTRR